MWSEVNKVHHHTTYKLIMILMTFSFHFFSFFFSVGRREKNMLKIFSFFSLVDQKEKGNFPSINPKHVNKWERGGWGDDVERMDYLTYFTNDEVFFSPRGEISFTTSRLYHRYYRLSLYDMLLLACISKTLYEDSY